MNELRADLATSGRLSRWPGTLKTVLLMIHTGPGNREKVEDFEQPFLRSGIWQAKRVKTSMKYTLLTRY